MPTRSTSKHPIATSKCPNVCAPELFVFLHRILFTNIQFDDFSTTLTRLLKRLNVKEPEGRGWTMIAAVNIGVLLEYSRQQGVLRRTGALGQMDRHPAAIAAMTKVKLARKAQADNWMEVNRDECRRSSDVEAIHVQSPSFIQLSPILPDVAASLDPSPAFKMPQELPSQCWLMLSGPPATAQIHISQFFSHSYRPSFCIRKASPCLCTLYLGQTSPHFLADDLEYRPITPRARSSARVASYQKTGLCMVWCGLGEYSRVDSGMMVKMRVGYAGRMGPPSQNVG